MNSTGAQNNTPPHCNAFVVSETERQLYRQFLHKLDQIYFLCSKNIVIYPQIWDIMREPLSFCLFFMLWTLSCIAC